MPPAIFGRRPFGLFVPKRGRLAKGWRRSTSEIATRKQPTGPATLVKNQPPGMVPPPTFPQSHREPPPAFFRGLRRTESDFRFSLSHPEKKGKILSKTRPS